MAIYPDPPLDWVGLVPDYYRPTRLLLLLVTADFLTTNEGKKTYCHLENFSRLSRFL